MAQGQEWAREVFCTSFLRHPFSGASLGWGMHPGKASSAPSLEMPPLASHSSGFPPSRRMGSA